VRNIDILDQMLDASLDHFALEDGSGATRKV
jgi:hypothetical protein